MCVIRSSVNKTKPVNNVIFLTIGDGRSDIAVDQIVENRIRPNLVNTVDIPKGWIEWDGFGADIHIIHSESWRTKPFWSSSRLMSSPWHFRIFWSFYKTGMCVLCSYLPPKDQRFPRVRYHTFLLQWETFFYLFVIIGQGIRVGGWVSCIQLPINGEWWWFDAVRTWFGIHGRSCDIQRKLLNTYGDIIDWTLSLQLGRWRQKNR